MTMESFRCGKSSNGGASSARYNSHQFLGLTQTETTTCVVVGSRITMDVLGSSDKGDDVVGHRVDDGLLV